MIDAEYRKSTPWRGGYDLDDAHLFGQNEFRIRAIAHRIAAKAVERHLAGKKTATKAPR